MGGAAAGEVAGGRGVEGGGGALGFRVTWVRGAPWPPAIEEEGPRAAATVRPAEGEAARERRRLAGVGPPVGGGRRRGREEAGGAVATSLVRVGGGGGRRRRRRGRRRSLGRRRMAGERRRILLRWVCGPSHMRGIDSPEVESSRLD